MGSTDSRPTLVSDVVKEKQQPNREDLSEDVDVENGKIHSKVSNEDISVCTESLCVDRLSRLTKDIGGQKHKKYKYFHCWVQDCHNISLGKDCIFCKECNKSFCKECSSMEIQETDEGYFCFSCIQEIDTQSDPSSEEEEEESFPLEQMTGRNRHRRKW
jgi:hypothetical protein